MEEKKPSESAISAAMTRAAHLILDDDPKILHDTLALSFSSMPDEQAVISTLNAFYKEMGQEMSPDFAKDYALSSRAYLVVRQRYAEDELGKALERGISQYVILGAGLDSFACRRPDLENKLKVFEVDHPDTQEWKKMRLRELGIDLPLNLTFVPVDFERQNLTNELRLAGCRIDIPAFFSMLGVVHYLTEGAIFQTLREIAVMATGSEIVFDYMLLNSLLDERDRRGITWGRSQKRQQGVQSQFDPVVLGERLKEIGYNDYLPVSECASKEVVSLPVHPSLKKSDLDMICGKLREIMC